MNGAVECIKENFEFLAMVEWKTYVGNLSHKMNTNPLYLKRTASGIPTFLICFGFIRVKGQKFHQFV